MPVTEEEGRTSESQAALVRIIAVIGAGPRGRAFALGCVAAGYQVVLQDVLSSKLRQAADQLEDGETLSQGTLRLATSIDDAVRDADFAIDFVPDELESKLEIFCMLDRMAPPKTILCTPTALSISDLQLCTYRPDKCIAVVPFDTLDGDLVRLIRGGATAASTVRVTVGVFEALGAALEIAAEDEPAAA